MFFFFVLADLMSCLVTGLRSAPILSIFMEPIQTVALQRGHSFVSVEFCTEQRAQKQV